MKPCRVCGGMWSAQERKITGLVKPWGFTFDCNRCRFMAFRKGTLRDTLCLTCHLWARRILRPLGSV
jgi:hypothetical protein